MFARADGSHELVGGARVTDIFEHELHARRWLEVRELQRCRRLLQVRDEVKLSWRPLVPSHDAAFVISMP